MGFCHSSRTAHSTWVSPPIWPGCQRKECGEGKTSGRLPAETELSPWLGGESRGRGVVWICLKTGHLEDEERRTTYGVQYSHT